MCDELLPVEQRRSWYGAPMPKELNISRAKAHLVTAVYRGVGNSVTAARTVLSEASVKPPGDATKWHAYAVARAVQQHQNWEDKELGWKADRI